MHMALHNDALMKLHTAYCHRMHARISAKACDANRSSSDERDFRCSGCNGLADQVSPDRLTASLCNALESVLEETADEVLSPFEDEDDPSSPYADEDALDTAVLELFPELQHLMDEEDEGDPEADLSSTEDESPRKWKARESRRGNSRKRYPVYTGRCPRCGGYVLNDIERCAGQKDDDVYRCFTCGWRTSPEYEWNRQNG